MTPADIEAIAEAMCTDTWDGAACSSCRNSARRILASRALADREARVRAEALREAADELPRLTEGTDRVGTETWRPHDRDVYSLAIEEAQAALRDHADRQEPQPLQFVCGVPHCDKHNHH